MTELDAIKKRLTDAIIWGKFEAPPLPPKKPPAKKLMEFASGV